MDASANAFAAFLRQLRPTPQDWSSARTAASGVAAVLRRHFRGDATHASRDDHLVAGSFGKRTAIRPLPALDLYYLLPETLCIGAPPSCAAMLDQTATALAEAGARPQLSDGWRVMVAGEGVVVAAIPCFSQGGAFLIPGTSGWRPSSPAAEAAALRLADGVSGGRIGDLLALLNAWRRTAAAAPSPFALEILVREFAAEAPGGSLPRMMADFMVWARRHTPAEFDLPGRLARLHIDDRWHGQAEAAYWRLALAERRAAAGEWADAAAEWRKLFGPTFPQPAQGDAT